VDDVEALEQAAVLALPPAFTEHVGGWLLRATPGVGRRRIDAVLPPRRADLAELPAVLDRARAFAEQHGHEPPGHAVRRAGPPRHRVGRARLKPRGADGGRRGGPRAVAAGGDGEPGGSALRPTRLRTLLRLRLPGPAVTRPLGLPARQPGDRSAPANTGRIRVALSRPASAPLGWGSRAVVARTRTPRALRHRCCPQLGSARTCRASSYRVDGAARLLTVTRCRPAPGTEP